MNSCAMQSRIHELFIELHVFMDRHAREVPRAFFMWVKYWLAFTTKRKSGRGARAAHDAKTDLTVTAGHS